MALGPACERGVVVFVQAIALLIIFPNRRAIVVVGHCQENETGSGVSCGLRDFAQTHSEGGMALLFFFLGVGPLHSTQELSFLSERSGIAKDSGASPGDELERVLPVPLDREFDARAHEADPRDHEDAAAQARRGILGRDSTHGSESVATIASTTIASTTTVVSVIAIAIATVAAVATVVTGTTEFSMCGEKVALANQVTAGLRR